MKKILWLPSWYPNKTSLFDGDFIQRHAMAAALYHPIHVIFVVKDPTSYGSRKTRIEHSIIGNLHETIAYIQPRKTGIGALDRFISFMTYLQVSRKLIAEYIQRQGLPELVHVHVALRAGLNAIQIKRKFKIPFVITEHWTGYNKKAQDNVYKRSWFFRIGIRQVLQNAGMLLPVSDHLGKLIADKFSTIPYKVIANAVNTNYYKFSKPMEVEFTFVHVSGMNYQKNCEGILRSFSKLLLVKKNIELIMVGPGGSELKTLANDLGISENVCWTGIISYTEVAAALQKASCMVMFSRYENLPCVILEALCCGLPVISSRVGGIPEVVNAVNGILVEAENEDELVWAMEQMINNYTVFNRRQIADNAAKRFSYEVIGRSISDTYSMFLQLNSSVSPPG